MITRWSRTIGVLTSAALVTAAPATAALAHECLVANQSAAGATNAAHSDNWVHLSVQQLFAEVFGLSGDALAAAAALAQERGLPTDIAVFTRFTIGTNRHTGEPTPGADRHGTDMRGLEHAFADGGLFWQLAAIAAEVAGG